MKKLWILIIMLFICPLINACDNNHVHNWGSWKSDLDGMTHTRVCKDNFLHTESDTHNWDNGEVICEASDLHNGLKKYTCNDCGYSYQEILPPIGNHNFILEIADEEHLYKYVSSATSIFYKTCVDCGAYGNNEHLFEKTILPNNYLEVEYIGSSGNQYIDTGFKANSETHIIFKGLYTSNYSIYGGSPGFLNFTSNSSVGYFYYGGMQEGTSLKSNLSKKIHVFEQNKNVCYVDGRFYHKFDYFSWQDEYNLFLFGRDYEGFLHDAGGVVKLYSCQIFDNDVLIRDYVPVQNLYTNEYGLFDLVNEKFYTFEYKLKKGEIIDSSRLPTGFTEVEYIESNGNQCIDTGISENAVWEFDIQFILNGERQLLGYSEHGAEYWGVQRDGTYGLWQGNTNIKAGGRDIIVHDFESALKTLSVNGEKILNIIDQDVHPSRTYKLFALNTKVEYSSAVKLFACKSWIKGNLVRDFVPCINNANGESGLYDLVSCRFYANSNTTTFNAGDISGHDFDEGEVLKEATYYQDGDILYSCKICKKQIHKIIEKYSYKVEFQVDDGVESIKIFRDYNPEVFEKNTIAYTRNINTFNYSKVDGVVICELVLKEGVEIYETLFTDSTIEVEKIENRYILSNINSDIKITIKTKSK